MNEDHIPGNSLHMEKLTQDFARFQSIIGWRIRQTDQWSPFERLKNKYGWPMLLRAAERCEPGKRWASDIERVCIQLDRDAKDAAKEQVQTAALPKRTHKLVKVGDRWETIPIEGNV